MFIPSLSFLACSLLLSSHFTSADYAEGSKPQKGTNENLERDRKALLAWKEKNVVTDPFGNLANWVEGGDVCYFGGVTCAKHPKTKLNTVGGIDFNGFHLGGPEGGMSLEGFLGTLPDIVFFHVNGNNFSGGILDDYSHLDYFYELDLSDNKFSGPFPSQFLTATKLTLFDIRFNKFSGPIPEEVFHLDLEVLFLNNNQFTGSIPTAIGKSGYYYITLANNQLTGGIPQEITQQKDLLEILFDGNTFGGTIPDGPWETVNLTSFYASNCGLTGTIPESLCELPSIVNLNVTGNDLDKELGPSCKKMMKHKKKTFVM